MWICLNNAFLSIVSKDCQPDELLVRARVPGHIEAVFPKAKVKETIGNDYQFRAAIKRSDVAEALVQQAESISYSNFKDSVRIKSLASAYSSVWGVMARLQPVAPYSTRARRQNHLF